MEDTDLPFPLPPHSFLTAAAFSSQFPGPQPSAETASPAPPARKKRGRPRKYGPPSPRRAGTAPSPAPARRLRGTAAGSPAAAAGSSNAQKKKAVLLGTSGVGFTPHMLFMDIGEDVYEKVTSFMQTIYPFKSCIISASGIVRDAFLKLPNGSCMLHKGTFMIISLSGLNLGIESSDKIKLTLCVNSGEIGKDIGGEVQGPLIAASSVQVIIGSFTTKQQDKLTSPGREETHCSQQSPIAMDNQFASFGSMNSIVIERNHDEVLIPATHQAQLLQPSSANLMHTWGHSSNLLSMLNPEGESPPQQARNIIPIVPQPRQGHLWWNSDLSNIYRGSQNDDGTL